MTDINTDAKRITVRTDTGQKILVMFDEGTTFRRVTRGATNLTGATRIGISDIRIGDRLLARSVDGTRGKTIVAGSVFVKAIASAK